MRPQRRAARPPPPQRLCPTYVSRRVKLPTSTLRSHVTQLAENGTLLPGAIVLAETPQDSGIRTCIACVEPVLVIEVLEKDKPRLVPRLPLDHALPPKHSHIVVNLAAQQQLT